MLRAVEQHIFVDGCYYFQSNSLLYKEYCCSPDFIVMWRQLVKELLHAILLSHRVHVGHLVVGEGGEEEVHLGSSSMVMSDFHRSGAVVGAD